MVLNRGEGQGLINRGWSQFQTYSIEHEDYASLEPRAFSKWMEQNRGHDPGLNLHYPMDRKAHAPFQRVLQWQHAHYQLLSLHCIKENRWLICNISLCYRLQELGQQDLAQTFQVGKVCEVKKASSPRLYRIDPKPVDFNGKTLKEFG